MKSDVQYIIGYDSQYDKHKHKTTPYFSYNTGEIILDGKSYGSSLMPFDGFIYSTTELDQTYEAGQILWVIKDQRFITIGAPDMYCREYTQKPNNTSDIRKNLIYYLNENLYHINAAGNLVKLLSNDDLDIT